MMLWAIKKVASFRHFFDTQAETASTQTLED